MRRTPPSVIFKGYRQSLRLVLPAGGDFAELCADLTRKLAVSGEFFRGARVFLDRRERSLAPGEVETIHAILAENGIELAAGEPRREPRPDLASAPVETLRSSVRSGQRIAVDGDLLILGDIHAGAEVLAGQDVFVLGAARGTIGAGLISGRAAVVFAFQLRPVLLRLGDLMARSPGGEPSWQAEVARVRDGRIVVESFTGWQVTSARRMHKE